MTARVLVAGLALSALTGAAVGALVGGVVFCAVTSRACAWGRR